MRRFVMGLVCGVLVGSSVTCSPRGAVEPCQGIQDRGCLGSDYAKHVVKWGKARSGDLRLTLQLIDTAFFAAARLWEPLGSAPCCQFQILF